MGLCDRTTGICTCNIGFIGLACNRKTCPNDCSGHGHCQSMQYYATQKDPGSGTVFTYQDNWDSDMMYGCKCDKGYFGYDCLDRACPVGDDPMTGTENDPNGKQEDEKQTVTCKATGGKFTLTFRQETTAYIAHDETLEGFTQKFLALSTITGADITFGSGSAVACQQDGVVITIKFTLQHGDVPLLVPDVSNLQHSSSIKEPELIVKEDLKGTKESDFCSNRGLCDVLTGYCACATNYDTSNGLGERGNALHNLGDCGFATASITNCAGEIACSGHGVCRDSPTYQCMCQAGWTSVDCSARTCPYDVAWFDRPISDGRAHQLAECSNNGLCDRTKGECTCAIGFEGGACERLSCPGSPVCNGHGKCLTMSHRAELAELNGDVTDLSYGATPNKPSTWDFDKIQGCACDQGYEGFDCSLRSCPYGDDPRTAWYTSGNHLDEVQMLTCTAVGQGQAVDSTFRLSFRCGKYNNIQKVTINERCTTDPIPWDATEKQVMAALVKLKTIGGETIGSEHEHNKYESGKLEVKFSLKEASKKSGVQPRTYNKLDKACTSGGTNTISVRFMSQFGNLPALVFTSPTKPAQVTMKVETDGVNGSQKGTKEMKVCSGRGLCDYTSGQCICASGFGSSDGYNHLGNRRDCGHVYQNPVAEGGP